jgi:hypothetical protein
MSPHLPLYLTLKMTNTVRSITLLAATAATAGYEWPNPRMEAFDFLRWYQAGAHGGILGTGVVPCNQFVGNPAGNQTNLGLDGVPLSLTTHAQWTRRARPPRQRWTSARRCWRRCVRHAPRVHIKIVFNIMNNITIQQEIPLRDGKEAAAATDGTQNRRNRTLGRCPSGWCTPTHWKKQSVSRKQEMRVQ